MVTLLLGCPLILNAQFSRFGADINNGEWKETASQPPIFNQNKVKPDTTTPEDVDPSTSAKADDPKPNSKTTVESTNLLPVSVHSLPNVWTAEELAKVHAAAASSTGTFFRVWILLVTSDVTISSELAAEYRKVVKSSDKLGVVTVAVMTCESMTSNVWCDSVSSQPSDTTVERLVLTVSPTQEILPTVAKSLKEASALAAHAIPDHVVKIQSNEEVGGVLNLATSGQKVAVFLMTEKSVTPALVKAVAFLNTHHVVLAMLSNPPAELQAQWHVTKLPAVVSLFATTAEDPNGGEMSYSVMQYDKKQLGPLSTITLGHFIKTLHGQAFPDAPRSMNGQDNIGQEDTVTSHRPAFSQEIPVLTNQQTFQEACGSGGGLCALLLLASPEMEGEHAADASLRQQVLEVATKSYTANDPYRFAMLYGACFPSFLEGLGLDPSVHLPTLVVLSPKKLRVAHFVGSMEVTSMRDFLRSVVTGTVRTSPISTLPAFPTEAPDCADGTFETVLPEELIIEENEDDAAEMASMLAEIRVDEAMKKKELAAQLAQEATEAAQAQSDADAATKKKKSKKKKKKKKKNTSHEEL